MTHKSRLDTRLPVIAGGGTNRMRIAITKKPGTMAGLSFLRAKRQFMPSQFGSPSEMNGT
ncbi:MULTISPECIES: hypothetical protein [Pseudomonas]|nr:MULTISPECIES: hypothetical protein [Pseudomonas]